MMPLPWEDYIRRVQGFEGNPNNPGFYRPKWDVRQWTSGFGTKASHPGERIDLPEAERRFSNEFGGAREQVRSRFPGLSTGREAALASLTMNAGPKWMGSGLGEAVKKGDWEDARRRLLQYTSPDPRLQEGLSRRRQQEAGWLTDVVAQAPAAPLGAPGRQAFADKYGGPMGAGLRPALGHFAFGNLPSYPTGGETAFRGPGNYGPPVALPPQEPAELAVQPPEPDIGMPDMSPGPGGGMAPPAFPPMHDPSAFAGPQLPEVPGIATTPAEPRTAGVISSRAPASDTGPSPPAVPQKEAPQGWGPQGAPPGVERRGPQGGMAPYQGGGGLYDFFAQKGPYASPENQGFGGGLQALQTGLTGPLGRMGLNMLFPGSKAVEAAHAANMEAMNRQRMQMAARGEQREEMTWQRQQEKLAKQDKIWNDVFPEGAPNAQHKLLDGVSPQLAQTIQAMGPEAGLPLLGQLSLYDAKKKADLELKMQEARVGNELLFGAPGGGAPGPAPEAGAMPPPMPAAPAPEAPMPFSGAGIGGGVPGMPTPPQAPPVLAPPMPGPGAMPRPAAAAPAAPMPVAPAPAGRLPMPPAQRPAEPEVFPGIGISEARRRAIAAEQRGYKTEGYQKAIAAAEKAAEPTEALRTEAGKIDDSYKNLVPALEEYRDYVTKHGGTQSMVWPSKHKALIEQMRSNLVVELKNMYSLGALQEADMRIMNDILYDPTKVSLTRNPKTEAGPFVDQLIRDVTRMRNNKVAKLGVEPLPLPPDRSEEVAKISGESKLEKRKAKALAGESKAPAGAIAEGTEVTLKGKPYVYRNGKWDEK